MQILNDFLVSQSSAGGIALVFTASVTHNNGVFIKLLVTYIRAIIACCFANNNYFETNSLDKYKLTRTLLQ